jgi:arsenite oxidase small subunit
VERRGFIKFCAAASVAGGAPALAADSRPQLYRRARLLDEHGAPLLANAIPPERNFIFHYPYASTPCFLLNLGRPAQASVQLKTVDQQPYEWRGGVGAGRSIVAYSAICAHKLTYPTRDISFISYRPEKNAASKHGKVIHCCSEHSQYDPAQGARVVAGPAPQPLASILLEHDERNDEIHALGTLGGELFNEFFEKYAFRLQMEMGKNPRAPIAGSCVVQALENYCRQQVKC